MSLAAGDDPENNSEDDSEEDEVQDRPPHRVDRPHETSRHRGEVSKQGGSGAEGSSPQGRQAGPNTGQSSYMGS